MTKDAQRARPRSDRYAAASIAQYLHELSGRHADERRQAVSESTTLAALDTSATIAGVRRLNGGKLREARARGARNPCLAGVGRTAFGAS
jgi:hypothetical protein